MLVVENAKAHVILQPCLLRAPLGKGLLALRALVGPGLQQGFGEGRTAFTRLCKRQGVHPMGWSLGPGKAIELLSGNELLGG